MLFKDYDQDQPQLLPKSLEEILSQDHLARLISTVIDEMDLSFIENTYSPAGCRAYNPRMLVKVLAYGYSIGVRSSRKLDDRLHEDIAFMWLSGRQTPDFRTISDFRKDRLGELKRVFIKVLSICREMGMIRVGKVSFDGTKLEADSSRGKMVYRKSLEKRQADINARVEQIFEEAEVLDREEEELYGDKTEHQTGLDGQEIGKRLAGIRRKKESLKKQTEKLNAKKKDNRAKLKKMRKDRNSMSTSDKDATLMQMKEGYLAPGYNVQLATEHQVVLAYGLYPDRNDSRLLKPMLEEVRENTGKYPDTSLADAGYGSKRNYRYLKQKQIDAFIPYNNFEQDMILRRKGILQEPKYPNAELERHKEAQRQKLTSPEGKEMMARRRRDVEPAIGDIKKNMGFRRFNLRGEKKCLVELGLVSIGHNLKKLKSYLSRMPDTGAAINGKAEEIWGLVPAIP